MLHKLVLKLVRDDILSLRQLEDVLQSVDNLDCSVRQNNTNVTSVNPAVLINGLSCFIGLVEVACEAVIASDADLSSGLVLSF